mgnify:CR=1 FL=1
MGATLTSIGLRATVENKSDFIYGFILENNHSQHGLENKCISAFVTGNNSVANRSTAALLSSLG